MGLFLKSVKKVAYRYLYGAVDDTSYDIILRLQILEGALPGSRPPGSWWQRGSLGLRDAAEAYEGTDIAPEWFSRQNTGMAAAVLGRLRSRFQSTFRTQGTYTSPEDIMQERVFGLNADFSEVYREGPTAFGFGSNVRGLYDNITSGVTTPSSLQGALGRRFALSVNNQRRRVDFLTNRVDTEYDMEGDSMLNQIPANVSDIAFSDFLATLLQTKTPESRRLEKKMREIARRNSLAHALIDKLVAGEAVSSIQELALERRRQGLVGGDPKTVVQRFYPAVKSFVESDPELLDLYAFETEAFRKAKKRIIARLLKKRRQRAII